MWTWNKGKKQHVETVSTNDVVADDWDGDEILQAFSPESSLQVDSVNDSDMSATFVIVTRGQNVNRQGNMVQIVPSKAGQGLLLHNYAMNPVVLWDHGQSGLVIPIGTSADETGNLLVTLAADKAIATCRFSRGRHAEPIYAAISEGIIRMASIGFEPIKAVKLQGKDGKMVGYDFVESEMLEWSPVPIGADPGALRQAIDRGKIHDVRLPVWMKQSFELLAEPVKKLGVGIDLPAGTTLTLPESIPGDAPTVGDMLKQLSESPTPLDVAEDIPTTETVTEPEVDPLAEMVAENQKLGLYDEKPDAASSEPDVDDAAGAVDEQLQQQEAMMQSLFAAVGATMQRVVLPLQNQAEKNAEALRRLTGRGM